MWFGVSFTGSRAVTVRLPEQPAPPVMPVVGRRSWPFRDDAELRDMDRARFQLLQFATVLQLFDSLSES